MWSRLWRWLPICAICACEQREVAPPPPPAIAPVDPTVRIEDVPRFANHRDRTSPYDCTIIATLQSHLPGTRVEPCGALARDATPEAKAEALSCATRAMAAARPVLFAHAIRGTDSNLASAYLARLERGGCEHCSAGSPRSEQYVAYEAHFDSDPCGGSCDDRGGTRIARCPGPPRMAPTCPDRGAACLECDDGRVVETCRNGKPSPVPRADAERARDAAIGASPASFVLGPLRLGAPLADLSSPAVVRAIADLEAGGIVDVVHDRPPHGTRVDGIAFDFAGPCTAVRAAIVARWGDSPDDLWMDPARHQRAHFDLEACRLRVERYHDVDAWIADTATAPFPLAAIGQPAAAFAKTVGAAGDHDNVRWIIPGLGRATGLVQVDAMVERGRIRSLDARGTTDPATLAALRARLTALRGPPIRDEHGRQIWRGAPPVHLDADGGTFSLGVSTWSDDPPASP